MSMVIESTYLDSEAIQSFCGSSHVRKNTFSKTIGQPSAAAFRAENDVVQ
jgi:hypothetical protein